MIGDIPLIPAPAVDACTGGGATAQAARVQGSPAAILTGATSRLQQAVKYLRIIEELNSAQQTLQQAWSGQASESAAQKILGSVGSFMKIVQAIQQSAALLTTSGGLIASAQGGYNGVMGTVNPTVAGLMSNPWTYGAAEALASGSVASLSTWITVIQAALHIKGATKLMQQVAIVMAIISDIEQLAQKGSTAADASSIISLYRAGKLEYNITNGPGQSSSSVVGSCPAPVAQSAPVIVDSPVQDFSDSVDA